MFDITYLSDADDAEKLADDAEKLKNAKWNISKLDDLQCILRDDFLALCDLMCPGSEMLTSYSMWKHFWIELAGMHQHFVNEFGWFQQTL